MARATSHNPLLDITNPTRTARNIACAMTFINALVEQGADSLSPDAREGQKAAFAAPKQRAAREPEGSMSVAAD